MDSTSNLAPEVTATLSDENPPISSDEQFSTAREYVGDYWADRLHSRDLSLRHFVRELGEPFVPDEDDLDPDSWGDEIGVLAGTSLRHSLRITDTMFLAMCQAYKNYCEKVEDDEATSVYDATWVKHVDRSPFSGTSASRGPLSQLASCQGGDEADLIFMHPVHGVHKRVSIDEYVARSAPYVATFGVELFPGDLEAGLVASEITAALKR